MLCQFLLYSEVNQLYVYLQPLPLGPPSRPHIPPIQVITVMFINTLVENLISLEQKEDQWLLSLQFSLLLSLRELHREKMDPLLPPSISIGETGFKLLGLVDRPFPFKHLNPLFPKKRVFHPMSESSMLAINKCSTIWIFLFV